MADIEPIPATPSTMVGSLDMTKPSDRREFVSAYKKRWPGLDDELKGTAVEAAKTALGMALDARSPRDVRGILAVLATMEGQQQADEHLAEKNSRIDGGKPTERIEARTYTLEFDQKG